MDSSRDNLPEPTAELSPDQLAEKKARASAIEPESWQAPETLGEYELRGLIGRGGMGRVYRYWDTRLERDVAIKFVRSLDEEGKAAARFHHPNVVAVYRVDEFDGRPYIVYQYVEGRSLDRMVPIASRRRLEQIARDLLRGLAAAHAQGVVHGDIKPANAMVERATGTAMLIDFGLARRMAQTGEDLEADREVARRSTSSNGPMGTRPYSAPELSAGAPIDPRSDVFAFGALLYKLCTGNTLPRSDDMAAIVDVPSLERDLGPEMAKIIVRCFEFDREKRHASGSEVLAALDRVTGGDEGKGAVATENPYRGLLRFERDHRALFFGRDPDIWRVVELMREQRLVIVAGTSGVGKSSLVRAGVLPHIAQAGIGRRRRFEVCTIVPGNRPLAAWSQALAKRLCHPGGESVVQLESAIGQELADRDWVALRRRLREQEAGTVLFFDQFEELATLSDQREAEILCEALGSLIAERTPGVRVLATARIDQVAELTRLPGIGPLVERAVYLLGPLGPRALRDTITRPAQAAGVGFESDDLVDELVTSVSNTRGGLPLLQFALAQLWESREDQTITRGALDATGGVEGALARHADQVVDSLLGDTRAAARDVMMDLVTPHGTRSRVVRTRLESGTRARSEALEALIRGRLVVTGEAEGLPVCEIAHEALVTGWPRLASWLEEASGARVLENLVTRAAESWDESGRGREALWGRRSLRRIEALDRDKLGDLERAFLAASRGAVARGWWFRGLALGIPVVVAGLVYGAVMYDQEQRRDEQIAGLLDETEIWLGTTRGYLEEFRTTKSIATNALRPESGSTISRTQREEAEKAWQRALSLEPQVDEGFREVQRLLEQASGLDSARDDVHERLAEVLNERAVWSEELGRRRERDELVATLALHDRQLADEWTAPVPVDMTIGAPGDAPGVRGWIESEGSDAERVEITTARPETLPPGSHVLAFDTGENDIQIRYPVYLRPRPVLATIRRKTGQAPPRETIRVTWPDADVLRENANLVYVPAGRFLFGYGSSSADEGVRSGYESIFLHRREVSAFWISRHEVTYGEWLEFVTWCRSNDCGPDEPELPRDESGDLGIAVQISDSGWQLTISSADHRDSASWGKSLVYGFRDPQDRTHDWSRMPVSGISAKDASAYLAWLDRSGRRPGARLCREDEWERAARGADGRLFPHGDRLLPDQSNHDRTYGRHRKKYGPDEVGRRQGSDSPFGLHDMTGNVWEMVQPLLVEDDDMNSANVIPVRGGSYLQPAFFSSSANRWLVTVTQRSAEVGFRLCINAD